MTASTGREILELAAAAKRTRRVQDGSTCSVCDGREHLSIAQGQVRCYSHLRSDIASLEWDHWAGVGVLPGARIPLSGNSHRDVTELRRLLGFDDLPAVDGDPQLLLAHLLLGIASLLVIFARWLADSVSARRLGQPAPAFPVVP